MKSNLKKRTGGILPMTAVLLVVVLLISVITLNGGWILFQQVNSQNATDMAARAALVSILGDSEVEGRTSRAQALGDRIYRLNRFLPSNETAFSADRIVFGDVDNAALPGLTFHEIAHSAQAIDAVQIVPAVGDERQKVNLFLSNLLGSPTSVDITSSSTVSTQNIDIVLCLDASRSMNLSVASRGVVPGWSIRQHHNNPPQPGSRWDDLSKVVDAFVTSLSGFNPNARVGLVTFGGGGRLPRWAIASELDREQARLENPLGIVLVRGSEINETMESYVSDYRAIGWGTSIYRGLEKSVEELNDGSDASKHIILLSDGRQTPSRRMKSSHPNAIVGARLAAEHGVVIHTISLGGDFALQTLSNETRGQNFTALTETELEEAFSNLLATFRVKLVN